MRCDFALQGNSWGYCETHKVSIRGVSMKSDPNTLQCPVAIVEDKCDSYRAALRAMGRLITSDVRRGEVFERHGIDPAELEES